jgi:nucleoside-diphosphate kinase
MEQKTLCLLKPDIVRRHLIGQAIKLLEQHFFISRMELQHLQKEKIEKFYEEHKSKTFFPQILNFMTLGPLVALELRAENAVSKLRELIGHPDPLLASEGTLRRRFGVSMDENSFHGSDSEKSAIRELDIIFSREVSREDGI